MVPQNTYLKRDFAPPDRRQTSTAGQACFTHNSLIRIVFIFFSYFYNYNIGIKEKRGRKMGG